MKLLFLLGLFFSVFYVPVIFVLAVIWLIALLDIWKSKFVGSDKLVWLFCVTIFPLVGPLLYFSIGRKQKVGYENNVMDSGELYISGRSQFGPKGEPEVKTTKFRTKE